MQPQSIVDVYKRTKEIFGDRFPEVAVFNVSQVAYSIERIVVEVDSKNIVLAGNIINGPDGAEKVESAIKMSIPATTGPAEYTVSQLLDAIERDDKEDILFYGMLFFGKMNGYDMLKSYGIADMDNRGGNPLLGRTNEIIEDTIKLVKGVIPKKHIDWIKGLPPALLFTDTDVRTWHGGAVILISHNGRFKFEDDPNTLTISPASACWPTTASTYAVPVSWIPFLLFPSKIKMEHMRAGPQTSPAGFKGGLYPNVHLGSFVVPMAGVEVKEECFFQHLGKNIPEFLAKRSMGYEVLRMG